MLRVLLYSMVLNRIVKNYRNKRGKPSFVVPAQTKNLLSNRKKSAVKIYKIMRELKVVAHKKRQEFLVELIEGIIKSLLVTFSEVADKMTRLIKVESSERRIQDLFEKVSINHS